MNISLKGWKKVSADGKKTVLKNKHGHELHIAHKSLNPSLRKGLEDLEGEDTHKMAEGGMAQNKTKEDPKQDDYQVGDEDSVGNKITKAAQSFFEPKTSQQPVRHYAEGTDNVSPAPEQPESGPDHSKAAEFGTAWRHAFGDATQAFKDVGNKAVDAVKPVVQAGKDFVGGLTGSDAQAAPAPQPVPVPDKQLAEAGADIADMQKPQVSPQQAYNNTAANEQQRAQEGENPITGAPEQAPQIASPEQGMQMGMQGADAQAKAESGLSKDQANLQGHQAEAYRSLNAKTQEHLNDIMRESDSWIEHLKDEKIDPNRYLGNMSTGRKIATGIGLILGGIGSGILRGKNPALEFLNQQIQRDLDAQQQNIHNKQTLLGALQQKYGNFKDAQDMASIMMAHQFTHELDQAAAKAGTPLALARAQQAKASIVEHYAPIMQQLATRRALLDINQQTQGAQMDSNNPTAQTERALPILDSVNPEAAKSIRERLVPGVGVASVPVPTEVRKELVAKENLIKASSGLLSDIQHNTLQGKLTPAKRAELEAKAVELQGLYRQGIGASTSEGEKKDIESIIGANPSALIDGPYKARLKALSTSQNTSLNTLKKQYGLPGQSDSKVLPQEVKTFNGHQYQRVEGGWKRIK